MASLTGSPLSGPPNKAMPGHPALLVTTSGREKSADSYCFGCPSTFSNQSSSTLCFVLHEFKRDQGPLNDLSSIQFCFTWGGVAK